MSTARGIIRDADNALHRAKSIDGTLIAIDAAKGRVTGVVIDGRTIEIGRTYDDHEIDVKPAIVAVLIEAGDLYHAAAEALEARVQVVEP